MKNTLKIVVFFSLFVAYWDTQAQVSASVFINGMDTKIGLGYQFNDKFWLDARIYTLATEQNILPEINFNYNFIRHDNHNIYLGASVVVAEFGALGVPIGLSIRPFPIKNLSIMMETSAMYTSGETNFVLLGFVGLRYLFD